MTDGRFTVHAHVLDEIQREIEQLQAAGVIGFPQLRRRVEAARTEAEVQHAVQELLAPLRQRLLFMCGVHRGR